VGNGEERLSFGPNGIRAVIFDWDGTLRHNHPSAVKVFQDYAVQLGVQDAMTMRLENARWTHYYWAQSPELQADLKTFPDEEVFWVNYARRSLLSYGSPARQAEQLAPEMHAYMKEVYKPEDRVGQDVPGTLQGLTDAGFRLAVLSNRTKPFNEQLQALGLGEYFEFALAAGEVDVWKPDPAVFHHTLQRLNLSPEQAIYVGDNYYADVIGAREAGLRPVLLDPEGIFPDAGCPVINSMGELSGVLGE